MSLHRVAAVNNFDKYFWSNIFFLTKSFESHGDIHGAGIDEGEEQDIGAELLIRMKFGLPVIVVRMKSKQYLLNFLLKTY